VDHPAGVEQVRSHLRHIAEAFSEGDFRIAGFVHDLAEVPGTRVMTEKRDLIRYEVREVPRGAEVRITSNDPAVIEAVHVFLAFQRSGHRAERHEAHGSGGR
jgi:hypothetical protein